MISFFFPSPSSFPYNLYLFVSLLLLFLHSITVLGFLFAQLIIFVSFLG